MRSAYALRQIAPGRVVEILSKLVNRNGWSEERAKLLELLYDISMKTGIKITKDMIGG